MSGDCILDVPNWKVLAAVVAGAPIVAAFASGTFPNENREDESAAAVEDGSAVFPKENEETGLGSSAGCFAAKPKVDPGAGTAADVSFFSFAVPNEKVIAGFDAEPKLKSDAFSSPAFLVASPKLNPSFLSPTKDAAGVTKVLDNV